MTTLVDRVRARMADEPRPLDPGGRPVGLRPPATPGEIAAAESGLGFPLPDLLKALYAEVANGGFSPYDFFGVPSSAVVAYWDVVGAYRHLSGDPYYHGGAWPDRLLPVADCGHEVFVCLDCSSPASRVIILSVDNAEFEDSDFDERDQSTWPFPDHPCRRLFQLAAPSLERYLESWLSGEHLRLL